MVFISKIDYRFYQKFYKHAWILSVILLVAVKLIGTEVNGAKRWISITKNTFIPTIRSCKIFNDNILCSNFGKK